MTSFTCKRHTPPSTGRDVFHAVPANTGILYVPNAGNYSDVSPWNEWGTIEEFAAPSVFEDGTIYDFTKPYVISELTYTRTFNNTNWQALYIPFSISLSVLEEKGLKVAELNDTHQVDKDGDGIADETTIEFFTLTRGATQPNYPYMIKADETGDVTIELEDVAISAAASVSIDCSTIKQLFTFTGTYTGVSGDDMFENNYYALAGGNFCRPEDNTVSLKPQRWYMSITNRDGSDVQYFAPSVRFSVDGFEEEGMQTMIGEVAGNPSSYEAIYTISGMRINQSVNALKPGLYVKGGKKFIVK